MSYAYTCIPTYPSGQIGFMLCSKAGDAADFAKPHRAPPASGALAWSPPRAPPDSIAGWLQARSRCGTTTHRSTAPHSPCRSLRAPRLPPASHLRELEVEMRPGAALHCVVPLLACKGRRVSALVLLFVLHRPELRIHSSPPQKLIRAVLALLRPP